MIASVIALIALSAVLSVYSATAHHSKLQLQSAHLHQQMRGILQLIDRDLRRAGYWQFEPATQFISDNPFQQGQNLVRSGNYPDESPDSCILLAYDLDKDGLVGVGQCSNRSCPEATDDDNVEQFGFRLRNGSVQSRYGGKTLNCGSGYWQTLNDPDIEITRLRFSLHRHCINLADTDQTCDDTTPQLVQRAISINLDAHLRNQPDTSASLIRWVMLRNDQLRAGAS
jgi:prepilin peptidase dependent protein B